MTNGYIQFSFLGGKEAKGALFQAVKDENSIMFRISQQDDFKNVKSVIESLLSQSIPAKSNFSFADEIEKYAKLKEKGVITDDEFIKKKREL